MLQSRADAQPTVGVVLGSGLGAFVDHLDERVVIPYRDVPHFPIGSVPGHAGELVLGRIGKVSLAVMSGRVHYYEGHAMERVTFPVRVLAGLGVKTLLVTNAAGAVNPEFRAGDFMVISDHLNLTGQNPLIGPNDDRFGLRFPDMTQAYSREAREILHEAGRAAQVSLREGVYAGLAGPCYETPAEIRMLRTLGADAVGMSTVAEVIVARHAGLRVAALSVITNRGAGLDPTPLSHDEVKAVAERVKKPLCALAVHAVQRLG